MVALLVIATILAFVLMDLVIQKVEKAYLPQAASAGAAAMEAGHGGAEIPLRVGQIYMPANLFFHRGHTWASVLGTGMVRVGADDFIRKVAGGIEAVSLPKIGDEVKQGDRLITIGHGQRKVSLPVPVDGVITAVNAAGTEQGGAGLYETGWLLEIKPKTLSRNLRTLRIADSAVQWIKDETDRLKDFVSGQVYEGKLAGQTAADGGLPVDGILARLGDEAWAEFDNKFIEA